MGKLSRPYMGNSMTNIVVISLGMIAVFFMYRYIKSLETDLLKLRVDVDQMVASSPKPFVGGPPRPVAAKVEVGPSAGPPVEGPLDLMDDDSIKSEDLTCMLRAVLVNDGIACVGMEGERHSEDDKVEICEAKEGSEPEESGVQSEQVEAPPEQLSTEEVRELLSGKTCEQLRLMLKERGIENLKGKKAELVERIMST